MTPKLRHHGSVPAPLSDASRAHLRELSRRLLHLHKALLDVQRRDHDADSLPVRSKGELLQLVLNDPEFAWLRTLSTVIVQLDELVHTDDLTTEDDARMLVERVRVLVQPGNDALPSPDFTDRYKAALQASPDAVIAHGAVIAALS
ncbi:MAG: hypothetical protein ABR606_09160 [Vicinamibacterales bacterium]